jgi:hypothetical protein
MNYKDTWEERDPQWKPSIYENVHDPIRIITSYVADGIVQLGEVVPHMPGIPPGCVKLKDIDGFVRDGEGNLITDENGRFQLTGEPDGRLDDADIVNFGSADPGFLMSLNNTLRYKGFDLNVFFYGLFDHLQYHPFTIETNYSDLRWNNNANPEIKDRWTIDNQDSRIAGTLATAYSGYGLGDTGLEKTWFVRCSNITLGYTLPSTIFNKYISNARFYIDGQNLFILTNYNGVDPETDGPDSYPNQRTFSVGVNLTF